MVVADRAIASSAEPLAYARNILASSFMNALPAFPDGTVKVFLFLCTASM